MAAPQSNISVTTARLSGGFSTIDVAKPTDDVLMQLPGFGSVPSNLARRIMAKEFIDTWELLPETW